MPNIRASEPTYISINETARRLKCAPRTVSRAVRSGELPGFRPGAKKILLRWQDVEQWIQSHRVQPNSSDPTIERGHVENVVAAQLLKEKAAE